MTVDVYGNLDKSSIYKYVRGTEEYAQEQSKLNKLFEEWAEDHLGQGYSLVKDEHTYEDPVTRWAFVAYKAGLKSAAKQRMLDGRSFMKELYSTILWLYRRLPRAYANPPHIDVVVRKLAQMVGEDAEEFISERKES